MKRNELRLEEQKALHDLEYHRNKLTMLLCASGNANTGICPIVMHALETNLLTSQQEAYSMLAVITLAILEIQHPNSDGYSHIMDYYGWRMDVASKEIQRCQMAGITSEGPTAAEQAIGYDIAQYEAFAALNSRSQAN